MLFMRSGWTLSEEVKENYTPIIKEYISQIENANDEPVVFNLSDTELNPYTLGELLESIGYEQYERDDNGWQLDFWIYYKKEGFKSLSVSGTGIIFELNLSEADC